MAWGAVAGFAGGRLDELMMRFVDVLYSLPFIFFVILLMVTFGSNIILIFVAIGAVEWLTMSRIVRGQTLTLKQKEFVEAARAAGLSQGGIIVRHIVPNLLGPVVVYVTLTIPAVILAESFLSFLGLGVQPPMASLGTLIANGAQDMELAPWLLVFPVAGDGRHPDELQLHRRRPCATRSIRRTARAGLLFAVRADRSVLPITIR